MDLLPDTQNCGLRMRRECRERFPFYRTQRIPLVSDPGIHHGTCLMHVPWCVSRSLTADSRKTFPATHNVTYLLRGPWYEWRYPSVSRSLLEITQNNTAQIWTTSTSQSRSSYVVNRSEEWDISIYIACSKLAIDAIIDSKTHIHINATEETMDMRHKCEMLAKISNYS